MPTHPLKFLTLSLVICVFILGIYLGKVLFTTPSSTQPLTPQKETPIIATATYFCKDNKFISGTFRDNKVDLVLSDHRQLSLSQAISASGARYANINESFVFWNKGNTAFITEDDEQTFGDCATLE